MATKTPKPCIVQTQRGVLLFDEEPDFIFCPDCTMKQKTMVNYSLVFDDKDQGHKFFVCPSCGDRMWAESTGTALEKRRKYGCE